MKIDLNPKAPGTYKQNEYDINVSLCLIFLIIFLIANNYLQYYNIR